MMMMTMKVEFLSPFFGNLFTTSPFSSLSLSNPISLSPVTSDGLLNDLPECQWRQQPAAPTRDVTVPGLDPAHDSGFFWKFYNLGDSGSKSGSRPILLCQRIRIHIFTNFRHISNSGYRSGSTKFVIIASLDPTAL